MTCGSQGQADLGIVNCKGVLNVAMHDKNANKSNPLSTTSMMKLYLMAVFEPCSVVLSSNPIVPRLRLVR